MAWGLEASSVNKIIVIQGQWPELDPHSPKTQKQKQQQQKNPDTVANTNSTTEVVKKGGPPMAPWLVSLN